MTYKLVKGSIPEEYVHLLLSNTKIRSPELVRCICNVLSRGRSRELVVSVYGESLATEVDRAIDRLEVLHNLFSQVRDIDESKLTDERSQKLKIKLLCEIKRTDNKFAIDALCSVLVDNLSVSKASGLHGVATKSIQRVRERHNALLSSYEKVRSLWSMVKSGAFRVKHPMQFTANQIAIIAQFAGIVFDPQSIPSENREPFFFPLLDQNKLPNGQSFLSMIIVSTSQIIEAAQSIGIQVDLSKTVQALSFDGLNSEYLLEIHARLKISKDGEEAKYYDGVTLNSIERPDGDFVLLGEHG